MKQYLLCSAVFVFSVCGMEKIVQKSAQNVMQPEKLAEQATILITTLDNNAPIDNNDRKELSSILKKYGVMSTNFQSERATLLRAAQLLAQKVQELSNSGAGVKKSGLLLQPQSRSTSRFVPTRRDLIVITLGMIVAVTVRELYEYFCA